MNVVSRLISVVAVLGLLAFVGIQVFGIVNDIKKKKALKKEAEKIDSDKKD